MQAHENFDLSVSNMPPQVSFPGPREPVELPDGLSDLELFQEICMPLRTTDLWHHVQGLHFRSHIKHHTTEHFRDKTPLPRPFVLTAWPLRRRWPKLWAISATTSTLVPRGNGRPGFTISRGYRSSWKFMFHSVSFSCQAKKP